MLDGQVVGREVLILHIDLLLDLHLVLGGYRLLGPLLLGLHALEDGVPRRCATGAEVRAHGRKATATDPHLVLRGGVQLF